MLEYPVLLVFPVAMAFAGAMDLMTLTISNKISIALIAAFAAAALLMGLPLQVVLMHLAAGASVLAVTTVMFYMGWLGGGDAKLLAAAALWIGFDLMMPYLLKVAVLGGVLALVILIYRRLPIASLPVPAFAKRLHTDGTGIPYGIAIAGGALWIYPATNWFAALTA